MEQTTRAKVKVILAGVLVLIAIVAVCVAKKKSSSETLKTVQRYLICSREECGHVFVEQVGVKEKPPYKCEQCGEQSAYRVLVCDRCGANVPMTQEKIEDNVCPYCGSHSLDFPRGDPRVGQEGPLGQ